MAVRDQNQFTGTVHSVTISGSNEESSHHCDFNIARVGSTETTPFRLDPFQPQPKQYQALLSVLVGAYLKKVEIEVKWDSPQPPFVHSITTITTGSGPSTQPDEPPRPEYWTMDGEVVALKGGTSTESSSFTLRSGGHPEEFGLDSVKYPKRAAAMLQVVAAAFVAQQKIWIRGFKTRDDKKGPLQGIRMGVPF
ncbi:MAG: hypothetical protein FJX02_04170 [Alphaproteobacteria bacterium]|nr:hypothetical protein [Alphaproteobacteria bacterium]